LPRQDLKLDALHVIVDSIPDSFHAPWVAFETLIRGPWKSGVLYEKISDRVLPVSSISTGYTTDVEPLSMGSGFYLGLLDGPPIPELLVTSLDTVFNRPQVGTLASLRPLDSWDGSKISTLTQFNPGAMFTSVCLFIIDPGGLAASLEAECPHALEGSMVRRAGRFLTKVLGASGIAFMVADTKYLCAYYSHAQGDPELLATQVARTMQRGLALSEADAFKTGPCLGAHPTGHKAESAILSFIDAI
jgi:hypothetical protein